MDSKKITKQSNEKFKQFLINNYELADMTVEEVNEIKAIYSAGLLDGAELLASTFKER